MLELNLAHAISCQKHLPLHPKWWEKFETNKELLAALLEKVKGWEDIVQRYENSQNTIHEISLVRHCSRYIRIVKNEVAA